MRISEWLASSASKLFKQTKDGEVEARMILSSILGKDYSYLLIHCETDITNKQRRKADLAINSRVNGIPLAYVLGHWDFFKDRFFISKQVLIPRSETELLVEKAVRWVNEHPGSYRIADIGTGSGCVVISLAKLFPEKIYYASDISRQAINVLKKNIRFHKLHNISVVKTKFLEGINRKFDLICANLPYIPSSRLQALPTFINEPVEALDGGIDGFQIIDTFLSQSTKWLQSSGCIICEIDDTHSYIAIKSAKKNWPDKNVQIQNDLSGKTRFLIIE